MKLTKFTTDSVWQNCPKCRGKGRISLVPETALAPDCFITDYNSKECFTCKETGIISIISGQPPKKLC